MTFSFIKYERDKLSERQAYLRPRTDEPDTGLAARDALHERRVREVVGTKASSVEPRSPVISGCKVALFFPYDLSPTASAI